MNIPYLVASKTQLLLQVKKDLGRHEGFRQWSYPDPLSDLHKRFPRLKWGYAPAKELVAAVDKSFSDWKQGSPWTVGYGFTDGVTEDSIMFQITAERKLEQKILEVDSALESLLSWYKATPFVVKTVLINMAFNLGLKGLLEFKNTLAYMKASNWKQAASNMRQSLWYKQVGSRAEELSKRIETLTIPDEFRAPDRI